MVGSLGMTELLPKDVNRVILYLAPGVVLNACACQSVVEPECPTLGVLQTENGEYIHSLLSVGAYEEPPEGDFNPANCEYEL